MIHLETLLDSPFRSIGILRYYDNLPQDCPAYDLRLDFDFAMVLVWHPARHRGELKALRRPPSSPRVDLRKSSEMAEFIHTHTGCTAISWERAKGRRYTLHRHGPHRWRLLPPPKPASTPAAPKEESCISQWYQLR